MKKMRKIYKTLQAKVEELESILDEALLVGPGTESHDSISNDIKQKIDFIENLISAEVASHTSMPHHLHHISERFASLKYQWETSRTFSFSYDDDNLGKDSISTCSCTESCLNEALDETELIVFEEQEKLFPDSFGEKALVEFRGEANGSVENHEEKEKIENGVDKLASSVCEDADFAGDKELVEFNGGDLVTKIEEEGKKNHDFQRESILGKKCCALAAGFVIGIIFMGFIMVNISDCFYYVQQVSFAIPT
ncbi:hypothetical protein VNO77_35656 [Canavalia gladiata]|uniref:DUF7610 domain-containing protein n=1 Tax=Canavalia gladiata TaxID=3824 RepID=A0AAN9K6C3_CANGL